MVFTHWRVQQYSLELIYKSMIRDLFIFTRYLHIWPRLYQGNETSFDTISDLFNLFELFQIYLNV